MRYLTRALFALLLAAFLPAVQAAHTQADLLLAASQVRPGDTVLAGVRLRMEDGWHTYWRNPGESGMATQIEWTLPDGVTAGPVQWPAPNKSMLADVLAYHYDHEVILLVPLKFDTNLSPGDLELKAKVTWLECKELCLPGEQTVSTAIAVGSEITSSTDAIVLHEWQQRVPQTSQTGTASWVSAISDDRRTLVFDWQSPTPLTAADFYPYPTDEYEISAVNYHPVNTTTSNQLMFKVTRYGEEWPTNIIGLLITEHTDNGTKITNASELNLAIPLRAMPVTTSTPVAVQNVSLWQMLLFAFLGGLILNIMPCVLPVIALKILGFVQQAKDEPHRVRKLGLIYGAGVLVSFLMLAALVIAVQAAGHRAGWGMQFQSPFFIVILCVLVTLVALNLFGVFEVTLSGGTLTAADKLARKHGNSGAFFNGVLATLLATPCTAPFLAPALGFAFAQPAPVVVLFFVTIAAGLAAPYIVLSWHPAWLRFLPKPGLWMERFKVAMGFPMLATAVWLFTLTQTYYGKRAWWLGLFLVLAAVAMWVFGEFFQRGRNHRGVALGLALAVLGLGYVFAVETKLRWREPLPPDATAALAMPAPDGVVWQPWSDEAVTHARAEGHPVLVDFTADWCVTCNAIVKPALERPEVKAKLKEVNAVALIADYTRFPPAITEELARFQRAGVPLVLVYPAETKAPAIILPDPNPLRGSAHYAGLVVEALGKAAQ